MLLAKLDQPKTYKLHLHHPVWKEVLNWLKAMPAGIEEGIYPLRDDESIFVNVHSYTTLSREACRYEVHRRFVDLQYLIEGEEVIEWTPLADLDAKNDFNTNKDVGHFHTPLYSAATLTLTPGSFAVFDFQDGHMPKGCVTSPSPLKKLVVKIDRKHLLA